MKKETHKRIFVAMAQYYWGKGPSIQEAIKQCRKPGASGRRGKDIKVFLLPEGSKDAYVNGMGDICWSGKSDYSIVDVS